MISNLPLSKLAASITLTIAAAFTGPPAAAQSTPPAAEVSLARLDCGTPVLNLVARFNDTWAWACEMTQSSHRRFLSQLP